jgi:hypothetical protein
MHGLRREGRRCAGVPSVASWTVVLAGSARPGSVCMNVHETPKQAARRFAGSMLRRFVCLHRSGGEPCLLPRPSQTSPNGREVDPADANEWARLGVERTRVSEWQTAIPLARPRDAAGRPGVVRRGRELRRRACRAGHLVHDRRGASSDDKADFAPLTGRAVTIWPNHDAAGAAHGERVAAKLQALGCNVETINVRELQLPDGGDVVDWLAAHPKRDKGRSSDLTALFEL